MLDATPQALHQRALGRAKIALDRGRIKNLYQSGSGKVMLPYTDGDPEVVFLNTSGGVTGGDRLSYECELLSNVATATSQTAERAYRSTTGTGRIETTLTVAEDATLFWLPQETILFEDSNLSRDLNVNLGREAKVLLLEAFTLGRSAMGETIRALEYQDTRSVYQSGKLIHREAVHLNPGGLARRSTSALCGENRAFASLVLIAPESHDYLAAVQNLKAKDAQINASAWGQNLVVRFAAPDAWPLKKAIVAAIDQLNICPLPRVWQI